MKRDGHKLIFKKTKSLEHLEGIFEIKHKKRPFEIIFTSKLRDWEKNPFLIKFAIRLSMAHLRKGDIRAMRPCVLPRVRPCALANNY